MHIYNSMKSLFNTFIKQTDKKTKIVFSVVIYVLLFASLVHLVEPETFTTFRDSLWYVVVTISTVGYGDLSPVTYIGKAIAGVLIVTGIGVFSFGVATGFEFVVSRKQKKEEGKMTFKGENHFVIVNWTERAKETYKELYIKHKDKKFVVIDDELEKTPISDSHFHFVSGDPSDDDSLHQANVTKSDSVLVFAKENVKPSTADALSLQTAISIERIEEEVGKDIEIYTIVEILNEKKISNFKHASVNEYITTNNSSAHLIAKAATFKGTSDVFHNLLSSQTGEDIYKLPNRPEWKTTCDVSVNLLKNGAKLFSILDKDGNVIKQKADVELPPDVQLLILSSEQVYNDIKNHPNS